MPLSNASRKIVYFVLIGIAVGLTSQVALAGQKDLGASGWRAEWDSSLDGLVDINLVDFIGDTLFIQKSAEFTQPSVNGVFPSIPIVFRQVAWPAAENIVIDDEIILNSTGEDWTDFHFDVLNQGDVVFDPVATANSGGSGVLGFTIAPFTQGAFTNNNTRLDVWGGVVPAGASWFPGDGATDGQLWMDVTPHELEQEWTNFTLKETPTPEPATLALFALGFLAVLRRR